MKIKTYKGNITEWDMVTANVSILAEEGLISEETYINLKEADRKARNITIGCLMRDLASEFNLSEKFEEYLKKYTNMFIEENKLKDANILEIARDAIFLYNSKPKYSKFGDYIKFKKKNTYYYMLEFTVSDTSNNKIILYKNDKGISVRGGTIDKNHKAYEYLCRLMSDVINSNTKSYIKSLATYSKIMNASEEQLIKGIDNTYLIKLMKEIYTTI